MPRKPVPGDSDHRSKMSTGSRNATYYFKTVTFKVEDSLFNVPRYHFEHTSEVFASMFSLPEGEHQAEGQCDENPIVLEGISSYDFEQLLNVLYPLNMPQVITAGTDSWMNQDQWIGVLKLATQWGFLDARKLAIQQLETMPSIAATEHVMLARQYEVASWLRKGYLALVERQEIISVEEAEKIGWKTAFLLCQLREKCGKTNNNSHRSRKGGYNYSSVSANPEYEIDRTFEAEFRLATLAAAAYENTPSDTALRLEFMTPSELIDWGAPAPKPDDDAWD
ncbi:hypothetical protein R3P38DRAFT_3014665 [Favolaschia claudopus]|uniref:BTB domain-containing protein n=1 Tax=Favolaschia claudopus TaxID=2862362 RepID=A0AAW0AIB4_9AGAR